MANGTWHSVVRLLRKAAVPHEGPSQDGDLLRQFLCSRDDAAFAGLVERHGPMVQGVCRRVLRNASDAEDAFQATFIVLACKAGTIGRPELLGTWLYRVAYRTALRARAQAAARKDRLPLAGDVAAPPATADVDWADLRPVLDEE